MRRPGLLVWWIPISHWAMILCDHSSIYMTHLYCVLNHVRSILLIHQLFMKVHSIWPSLPLQEEHLLTTHNTSLPLVNFAAGTSRQSPWDSWTAQRILVSIPKHTSSASQQVWDMPRGIFGTVWNAHLGFSSTNKTNAASKWCHFLSHWSVVSFSTLPGGEEPGSIG